MSEGTKTLLEMTQDILGSMKSDEVNSIGDTAESTSVAETIRETYEFMVASMSQTDHMSLFELTALGPSTPTLMALPANAETLQWVKYNSKEKVGDPYPRFVDVRFLSLKEFLDWTSITPQEPDTTLGSFNRVVYGDSIEFFYRNNKHPEFCAYLDDRTLVFDSFNVNFEANLQSTNTQCFGNLSPTFQMLDSFVIPFNRLNTQMLFQEAKSQCFLEFRQIENPKAEQRSKRLRVVSQKRSSSERNDKYSYGGAFDDLPNYGRK